MKQMITIQDLMYRCHHVIEKENDVYRSQFARNGVDVLEGHASFVDPHTITIEGDGPAIVIQAERVVIATGTVPAASPDVPVGGSAIIDADGIFDLKRVPSTMIVVGAGVIGMEYACMFATLGSLVTVVESRKRLLEFVDAEIIEALMYHSGRTASPSVAASPWSGSSAILRAASPLISRAARRCAPTCSSTRWAARATPPGSGSTRRGSRPTTAAACAWTTASAPPCLTSMPRAT